MANGTSRLSWGLAVVAVLGAALAVWWVRDPVAGPEAAPAGGAPAEANAQASPTPAPEPPPGAPAPSVHIEDRGRLRVRLDDLRDGDVFAIGLGMPDEPRASGPRPVKVIDVTGRLFETTAEPIEGHETGVRLEIDSDWLQPGQYMIQVETGERTHLGLRRYVLEVE